MVMNALKRRWRGQAQRIRPKVSTRAYVQELSLLLGMVEMPIAHDASDLAGIRTTLQRYASLAPQDARLGDVHAWAVRYVRAFLKVQELWLTWNQTIGHGDRTAAPREYTAMKQGQATLDKVKAEFTQALRVLSATHPDLYRQLDVPSTLR